ncbi:MAG: AAA family ATPase [Gammaproteobacteria bacterium]|nr:AAA family ATPase [Gammaproteobacteria bacterium]
MPLPNVITRYLHAYIQEDLKKKMVFLGWPRQVGKTNLAFEMLGTENRQHFAYLNWDSPYARKQLLDGEILGGRSLLVLDDIHKFLRWRNLIKSFSDIYGDQTSFLVTALARLDYYRKGGGSLQSRYHHY